MLALMLTILVSAQNQERHVYYNMAISIDGKDTVEEASSTVYINYENKPVIKVYAPNGTVAMYDSISEIVEGATSNGTAYWAGYYRRRDSDIIVIVQLFKDSSYGIRFISPDSDTSIQFY